jgi:hypothetical protein
LVLAGTWISPGFPGFTSALTGINTYFVDCRPS